MNMNKEYKMLREEIMFNMKQVYLYFTFTVPAVSAMLVFVFKNIEKPNSMNIFIAIFVLLICAAARVKKLIVANVRISTYMEVFLEPNIDERNWETRSNYQVNGCNSKELDNKNFLFNIMIFKSISPWFLLGIIIYVLYIIILYENNKENISDIFVSFLFNLLINSFLFFLLMYITLKNDKNEREKYKNHWKNIKET